MKIRESYQKNARLLLGLLLVITICLNLFILIAHISSGLAAYALCDLFIAIVDIVLFAYLFNGHISLCIIYIMNKLVTFYLLLSKNIPIEFDGDENDKYILYFIIGIFAFQVLFLFLMIYFGSFKALNNKYNNIKICKKYLKDRYNHNFILIKSSKPQRTDYLFKDNNNISFSVYIEDNIVKDDYLESTLAYKIDNLLLNKKVKSDIYSIFDICSKGGSTLFQDEKDFSNINYEIFADRMSSYSMDINLRYIISLNIEDFVKEGVSQVIRVLSYLINNNYYFTTITIRDIGAYLLGQNDCIIPPISYVTAKEILENEKYDYLYKMFNEYNDLYNTDEETNLIQ